MVVDRREIVVIGADLDGSIAAREIALAGLYPLLIATKRRDRGKGCSFCREETCYRTIYASPLPYMNSNDTPPSLACSNQLVRLDPADQSVAYARMLRRYLGFYHVMHSNIDFLL